MTQRLLACLALLALAACSTTTIVDQWQSPAYTGGPFKRILVVAITKEAMTRRIVEDEFVKQLKARGTDAIASYTLIAEQGPVDKPRLEAALRESRSDAAITTRVVKVERKSQIVRGPLQVGSPEVVPGSPLIPYYDIYGFYGSGFPGAWGGYATPPTVFEYDDVRVETQLFDARTAALVWTANSDVFAPTEPARDSADFAETMIKALAARKLI
jgi:hypothetical protein